MNFMIISSHFDEKNDDSYSLCIDNSELNEILETILYF